MPTWAPSRSRLRSAERLRTGALALAVTVLTACGDGTTPRPGSPEYQEAVRAFYTGVAAIQVGDDQRAEGALSRVAELAPGEPAAAADLALVAYEQRRLDDASRWIDEALGRAPEDARVRMLAALVAEARGGLDAAVDHLRAAGQSPTPDPRARLLLSRLLERRAGPGDLAESRRVLDALLAADTANVFLRVESARQAARHGNQEALARALDWLEAHAASWPVQDRRQLEEVRAVSGRPEDAGAELTFLAASLEELPAYARDRAALEVAEQRPDVIVTEFLRMPTPSPSPPPPDTGLEFVTAALEAPDRAWREVRPVWLDGESPARVGLLEPGGVWLSGEGGEARAGAGGAGAEPSSGDRAVRVAEVPSSSSAPDAPVAFATLDLDHDFLMDLAVAGSGGLILLAGDSAGGFVPLPEDALPAPARTRVYQGVWAADTDVDGDVDLVVAARDGPVSVLRNRGDGTFDGQDLFGDGVRDARQLVWGDLDDDGDPDAVFLQGDGQVRVLLDPRRDLPRFVPRETPVGLGSARAVALGDLDADGHFELVALRADGTLVGASLTPEGWDVWTLARWDDLSPDATDARLFVADLDNNGALDVAASAGGRTRTWLADSMYTLVPHGTLPVAVTAVGDLRGEGRVALLGLGADGRPVRLSSRSTLSYYALTVVPRAASQPGDGRINTFGIGGEAEVRAGMLYQKQPIDRPFVHFGIGENTGVTVARILWPNGTAQAEFDLLASQGRPIIATQRLKGSCPWLFAFDGTAMRFVTDVAWRTAVGLRINTFGATSVIQSPDWVRVRGDQLRARDGVYDLRITAELWESHFFDQVALMTVDHPVETDVFVDERFVLPPPELEVEATGPLHPVAAARDDRGRDVTDLVRALDERYLDGFELGRYQGIVREHRVEVELGPEVPVDGPLLLVGQGWVYPTDGSINLALGQGDHPLAMGLRAEVPDGRGGWRVLHADLGMPAGKTKTVLVDLTGAFRDGGPRRVRLVTNLEIYWDRLAWTVARPATELRIRKLLPEAAELRFRGFSRTRQAGRKAPELPEYEVAGTAPRWRGLEGYHTRFGEVGELLEEVDDRYVIMGSGDELALRFRAPPDPPEGWVRDYVFVSDAWIKDGDLNNGFSRTLRPLPYHGLTDYTVPPGRLEDDPAYLRHPEDWRVYHTRYLTSDPFHDALVRR